MDKIKVKDNNMQYASCDQIEFFAKSLRNTSNVDVNVKIEPTDGVYKDTKEYLEETYDGITVDCSDPYIRINDEAAKDILIENLSSDGIGVKISEADSVTSFGGIFKNSDIKTVDWLGLFSNYHKLEDGMFDGCNIDIADFDSCTNITQCEDYIGGEIRVLKMNNVITTIKDLRYVFSNVSCEEMYIKKLISPITNNHDTFFHLYQTQKKKVRILDISEWDTVNYVREFRYMDCFGGVHTCYIGSGLFNCCTRETEPIESQNLSMFSSWNDEETIRQMINVLPVVSSCILKLSSTTKSVVESFGLTSAANEKGWTIE